MKAGDLVYAVVGIRQNESHHQQGGQLEEENQVLVRFQDETSILRLSRSEGDQKQLQHQLLFEWSVHSGWPVRYLMIRSWDLPFVTIGTRSSIRGGKGGFGTLLKGQSRQAGAKLTTDFGACRDLQGRRLRHVNDEIKLRKWREAKRREKAGEKVPDDELWNTPSGIYNWHLMTPTWADISKKATYRIKRQFQQLDKESQRAAIKKQEQEKVYENSMSRYVEEATSVTERIQQSIPDALQQGLAAAAATKKKRKRSGGSIAVAQFEKAEPNSLVTLSGDIVIEVPSSSSNSPLEFSTLSDVHIQSKSDFGTAALVLEGFYEKTPRIIYYEITLVSGGLAQIGWAMMVGESGFSPNDELGDGVGDDSASFAIDGSRGLKFHGGREEQYSLQWKAGDRLGCWIDTEKSLIGYSINGRESGTAFAIEHGIYQGLVPAFSCNKGQILKLHSNEKDCLYFPSHGAIAVGDLLTERQSAGQTPPGSYTPNEGTNEEVELGSLSKQLGTRPEHRQESSRVTKLVEKKQVSPEFLVLDDFHSAQELEAVGLDRLKSALMALQVKCGGSLAERAARLFSLKGLARKDYPNKVRSKGFLE